MAKNEKKVIKTNYIGDDRAKIKGSQGIPPRTPTTDEIKEKGKK